MANIWTAVIKTEIQKVLRPQNAHDKFIGKHKLHEIWETAFQNQIFTGPEREICRSLIRNEDDCSLLILASILVYIDWNAWENFSNLFTDAQGNTTSQLPLTDDAAESLLGSKGTNFCDSQTIFLPVTIIEGENLRFSKWDRLPIEEKECRTSTGVSGTVKKIVIARGYFKDSNGDPNQQVFDFHPFMSD